MTRFFPSFKFFAVFAAAGVSLFVFFSLGRHFNTSKGESALARFQIPNTVPSVVMAGFASDRSLTQHFNDDPFLINRAVEINEHPFKSAGKSVPLFLNSTDVEALLPESNFLKLNNVKIDSQLLIFLSNKNELVFFDFKYPENVVQIKIPIQSPLKSLAYLKKYNLIYISSDRKIFTLDMKSGEVAEYSFDLTNEDSNLIENNYFKNVSFRPCNSSLAFLQNQNLSALYFGCSTPSGYGTNQGVTGGVVVWPVKPQSGQPLPFQKNYFKTFSKVNPENKFSGYNTGVWNAGLGPTVLKDRYLVVATGNGPNYPKIENYGCHVLVFDTLTDKVIFSDAADDSSFQECLDLNLDASSGVIQRVESGGQQYLTSAADDGQLRILKFSEENFFKPIQKVTFRLNRPHVNGNHLTYLNMKDELQVVVLNKERRSNPQSFVIEGSTTFDQVEKTCVGWIRQYPAEEIKSKDHLELNFYYAGDFRRVGVWTTKDWATQNNLTQIEKPKFVTAGASSVFWSPFAESSQKMKVSLDLTQPNGYAPKWLGVQNTANGPINVVVTPENANEAKPLVPLFYDSGNPKFPCGPNEDQDYLRSLGFVKVFETVNQTMSTSKNDLEALWSLEAFQVRPDLKVELKWRLDGDPGSTVPNASFLTLVGGPSNQNRVILLTSKSVDQSSRLQIVNTESGALISETDYQGSPHFSHPIVLGQYLFIPTRDQGLKVFELKLNSK